MSLNLIQTIHFISVLYFSSAVCGYGTYSPTGLVPCLQCPSNTFSSLPPRDGFKECQKCPANTMTYSPGSKLFDDCRGNNSSYLTTVFLLLLTSNI